MIRPPANDAHAAGIVRPVTRIGFFRRLGNEWHGSIITLSVQQMNVRIVPDHAVAPGAPASWRVLAGSVDIGAGREEAPGARRWAVLQLLLDDPSFAEPIAARLVPEDGGEHYVLTWRRSRPKECPQ